MHALLPSPLCRENIDNYYTPHHRGWNGVILDSPRCLSVCPSVRPSVDKVSGTFWKKTIGPINFIPGIYPYGVSLLTPIHFRVPSLIFSPLVAKYLAENGVSETFWKTIGWIHFIPDIYPYGVSLLTPIHFCVPSLIFSPLVAKYLPKMGFPELFEKTIGSIHFIYTWHLPLWGESLDPYTFSCS